MIFCHPEDASSGRSVEDTDLKGTDEYSWYSWEPEHDHHDTPVPVVAPLGPIVATDAPRQANAINTQSDYDICVSEPDLARC